MSVTPCLSCQTVTVGELLEAGLGAEVAEPGLTKVRRVADAAHLVDPHHPAVGQLEQRGGVGEVVVELADRPVEDAVAALITTPRRSR